METGNEIIWRWKDDNKEYVQDKIFDKIDNLICVVKTESRAFKRWMDINDLDIIEIK